MQSIKSNHIKNLIDERDLSHITSAYFDMNGRLRAKHLHSDNVDKAMTTGTAINLGIFSLAPDETQMHNSRFLDPDNQFRDGMLWLDPESYRDFPLDADGNGIILIGQLMDEYAAYCPRSLLQNELDRYSQLDLQPYGAFEFECYMLDETETSIQSKVPSELKFSTDFEKLYDFTKQVNQSKLLQSLMDVCEHMEIPIDALHSEFSGILETALQPQSGIMIADNAALYKAVSKAISLNHGILASYMARINTTSQACGAHINLSLRSNNGDDNLCFDETADNNMSELSLYFIGGLQKYTPELFLLHCPTLNSWRRLQPDLFAPLSNTWGIDNKTVAYRMVNRSAELARVECRLPGADVNPYLSLAALLIAGRLGIEEQCMPDTAISGDGWSQPGPKGLEYPPNFSAAIDLFHRSSIAQKYLSTEFVEEYVRNRQWQLEVFDNTITDWELRTFIEGS